MILTLIYLACFCAFVVFYILGAYLTWQLEIYNSVKYKLEQVNYSVKDYPEKYLKMDKPIMVMGFSFHLFFWPVVLVPQVILFTIRFLKEKYNFSGLDMDKQLVKRAIALQEPKVELEPNKEKSGHAFR